MKKIRSVLFIISIVITACGPVATSRPRPTPEADGKTPEPTQTPHGESRLGVEEEKLKGLEISVWYPWYGVEASLFETLIEDFNSSNPWRIKVTAESQVNFSYLYETVTASLPTQERPDLVIALPEHALAWDAERVVADLTPYVEDPAYGMDMSDFYPVFLDQDQVGDRRVALPAQRTARFLLWNQSWADDLGFDAAPVTRVDFRQQACQANRAMRTDETPGNDGMGGWIIDTEPMTVFSWLLAFGGGVLEGNDYRFQTPNNIEAFKFLKSLAEDSCAWQMPAGQDGDPMAAFAARQALFVTAGLEDLPAVSRALAAADNPDDWTVILFPGQGAGTLAVYGSSYVILKSSPEEQLAAWLFTRWLTDPVQDARRVETTHLFPLRTSTLDLLGDYQAARPQWDAAVELLSQGEIQPQLESWRSVKVMMGDAFTHMFRTNLPSGQVAKILVQMESLARDLSR
jgi:multiple sugar transport system substrate-binding protein